MRSLSAALSLGHESPLRNNGDGGAAGLAAERIRKAIALVNSVADEAGDEEITPTEIAEAIRDCLELSEIDDVPKVRHYLGEALDAVSDGMPADFVAMTLYAALGALREG